MNKKLHTLFEGLHTFLILWVTQSFSALGSSMTSYALVVWSYQQKGSALTTALLSICSYAPYVLLSIFAGALSDRWNTAAMSSPVRKKRTPMSWAGGSTSTASFITTKANPQIMVAANSMSLHTKPGICLFSVTACHYSAAFRVSPGYCQPTGAQRNLVDGCEAHAAGA